MHYSCKVFIRLKPGIPDIKSIEIMRALKSHGFDEGVINIDSGKVIELELDHDSIKEWPAMVETEVEGMISKLLAHRVTEEATYKLTAHVVQADGSTVKCPMAHGEPFYGSTPKVVEPWRPVYSIDLTGRWPAIGPYRIIRADFWKPRSLFVSIRYTKKDEEQPLGWSLELSKRAFLDDVESEVGKVRGATLRRLSGEITDYVLRYLSVYGVPEPIYIDEHGKRI